MAIKVTVDMSGVEKKLDKIASDDALGLYMAQQGMKFMNERYVPKRDGALRASAKAEPWAITWNTPYAYRHWSGYGDTNRTTPGTQSHWEQPASVAEYIAKQATNYLKR